MSAATILTKELKELSRNPTYHVTLRNDNIFEWTLGLYIVNPDSPWHHAYLTANINFTRQYPYTPPTFVFSPAIYHPNVYNDGRVCISILHSATGDFTGEPENETWSPAQCVESVIMSIISILDDPNIQSPANIEASNMWRDHRDKYNERIKQYAKKTHANIPEDFDIPNDNVVCGSAKQEDEDDWYFDEESDDDNEDEEDEDDDADQMSYEEDEAEMSEDYGEDEK